MQLPAKRVLEGEVVTPLTVTIETRGTKELLEKLKDAKETINRMKKNGWVRPVFPFEKLDEGAIDGGISMSDMKSNQLGVFRISLEMIRRQPRLVARVFALLNVVPVRAEALYVSNCIEYVALSDRFEPIPQDTKPPEYELHITDDGNLLVEVEKV